MSADEPARSGDRVESEVKKWRPPRMQPGAGRVFRRETGETGDSDAAIPATRSEVSEQEISQTPIPTAEEIENWHRQAHEEGYQQGLQQAQQEVAELKRQLQQIMRFFEQPLQFMNDEVEQQLYLLAVTLAQQLVRRELRTEPGEIIAVIRESVKLLPLNSRKISIFLHPEDAEIVRKTLQLDEKDEERSWSLVEDPMITRGGCEIKSDQSVINATLENRLQALAASLLGGERQQDKDDAAVD